MQIMEDVREGCNAQPSSPGHADQRSDEGKLEENGYEELNTDKENDEKCNQEEESKKSGNESEMVDIDKEEPLIEENYCNTNSPNAETNKRKSDTDDFPIKRLRSDIHDNFVSRDKIVNEFIEMADCNNLEQIHMFSEQLLAEIKTLNELAKEKEREWNNIIHLKKLKEELLLRMQRKKQVMLINDKSDYVDLLNESQNENHEERFKNISSQSILKANLTCPQKTSLKIPNVSMNGEKMKTRNILPKPQLSSLDLNGFDYRQGKQRPTLDVQSIIADYRQRHPETVPRRGRRIRGTQMDGKMNILNFSSMALGSGSQVRQNAQDVSNELGLLLNTINVNRQEGMKLSNSEMASSNTQDAVSFKDMLLQFARLSQSERNELIQNAIKPPPPYPEVTVHPVPTTTAAPTNSLLHGILTKSPNKQNSKTSFSPTLARLLTAPERAANIGQTTPTSTMPNNTSIHPSNVSISEILSTSKARNEITITPVETQFESTSSKGRLTVEEEAEDSADRLVIDESNEAIECRRTNAAMADNSSDNGDEVPQCQGCNQKPAQFVCAGCGNQWYCSRDCQVYQPSLWYFEKLAFLNEHLQIRISRSSLRTSEFEEAEQDTESQEEQNEIEEGSYNVGVDGVLSPTLERRSSIESSLSESTRCRSPLREAPTPSTSTRVTSKSQMCGTKTPRRLKKAEEFELTALKDISEGLGRVATTFQQRQQPSAVAKTSEDIIGEFVAAQLKKIKNEDVKEDAQFEIHRILRDALKRK